MPSRQVAVDEWWEREGHSAGEAPWWVNVFRERETLLRDTFGMTSPPEHVFPLEWQDSALRVPGACALSFPPTTGRHHWLTVSHGLTQPLTVSEVVPHGVSGYGWEFALQTGVEAPWAPDLLEQLITYWKLTGRRIDIGHRVPTLFQRTPSWGVRAWVKKAGPDVPDRIGDIEALLFWPYLYVNQDFATTTGRFGILVGTGITHEELRMAKETSSAHLMLLLCWAGVGQQTDPYRTSVTKAERVVREWDRIRALSTAEAERTLSHYRDL